MAAPIPKETDVVVIGGGPAGASTAIGLAGLQHRVVVLDRAKFPRPHIGESLPPKIEPLLAILGLSRRVDAAGFVRSVATTVYQGEEILTHPFDPTTGVSGYQVDRGRFDQLILERAREVGASVFEDVAVTGVTDTGVTYEGGAIACRFVVDASGAAGVVAKALDLRERDTIRTVALTGYWTGTSRPEQFEAEDTLFEMMPDGWLWSVLLSDGRRNVTLGVDASTVKENEALPMDLYLDRVGKSELVGKLVEGAELTGGLSATDATWSRAKKYAGERFLLCGDAAAKIDPLTAHGVFKALQSGITASAVVNTVLRKPENTPLALAYYETMQTRTMLNYASVALTFYRGSPYVNEPFWSKRTRSEIALTAEIDDVYTAAGADRRERFRDDVEHKGGQRVSLSRRESLRVEVLPSAEGVFIVERPALVGEKDIRVELPAALKPQVLFDLLDGRKMAELFDGYAEATHQAPNRNLGKALMIALMTLVERGLVEVGLDGKPAY